MGITISTIDCTEEIKNRLKENSSELIIAEDKTEDYTFFQIDFAQKQDYNNIEFLASVIADIVIDKLEKKFINRIIRHKYQQFTPEQRTEIEQLTINYLNDKNRTDSKIIGTIIRKKEIVKQIIDYLKNNQDLNIEGFVRFRLPDYLNKLKLAVERGVDDYIVEKEYNEFIELLKYFVDLQEPRIILVHVLQEEDGSFQIVDKYENKINNEYLEGYLAEMFEEDVEYEDLLISALINVAPLEIVLHFSELEIETTIKNIFGKRVKICEGCQLCKK